MVLSLCEHSTCGQNDEEGDLGLIKFCHTYYRIIFFIHGIGRRITNLE